MEEFICRQNIEAYKERLQRERDERSRRALAVLLRMEEAKLAQLHVPAASEHGVGGVEAR
ncbi:hypothetical protein RA307_01945 [Xanthobacteraceae bacterium Astr-EGSB]|uniref:hypothetical protein n=1 Tax=Astrobacterium formosum TaxID=3069710 RepID=UPI0027AEB8CC|nr:hypothetical protein [Xanthobacteraceae bacterium Astr-EGSB]